MSQLSLAVSIITCRRSELLESCLRSLEKAMTKEMHPVYIIIQDATREDLDVLQKYEILIKEIVHTKSDCLDVEHLINRNRILAWEVPLIERGYEYVMCLEDDVEIREDIFEFTINVLKQNADSKKFWGINYGSFEKPEDIGSYSKLRFGLHGPASLISRRSFKKFQLGTLGKFAGAIPWDAWVEPIVKRGYVATSNVARYRDNGLNGTHAKAVNNIEYFQKLNESFRFGEKKRSLEFRNLDIKHTWRKDCQIYEKSHATTFYLRYLAIRFYQIVKIIKKTLMELP